jgi:hypothetical protein
MMYALMVTTGIADPTTPLPGFGKRRTLYFYQARSLFSRIRRSLAAAIAKKLP